jgi:crotonobetaine/carnitine-CoA ligase
VRGAVTDAPDHPWIDFEGEAHTFAEVWDRALRVATGLRGLGIGEGQTVCTLLDSSVDPVAIWIGANLLGAIWVPVNTAHKGEFLRHQLADSAAPVVIAEVDFAERVEAVRGGLPDLVNVVVRGPSLDALSAHDRLLDPVALDPRQLSLLIYTSGTTGPSKGCMLSHSYVCNVAAGATRNRTPGETLWTPLPMFHLNAAATSILATAVTRSTLAITRRFSLSGFWPEIRRNGATMISLLGAMIPLIATAPDTEDSLACKGQIRYAGGAPYPPEIARVWRERFGVPIVGSSIFGLTEATFLTWTPEGVQHPPGSAGIRNDDFDVRLFDDRDREVAVGEVGEIVARPLRPHVMFEGYWRRPEATAAVWRNGWFHTGDLGRFDDDGWLWFVDRQKDYLRRRGENISSMELEAAFLTHPDLVEVAVHAVPSELTEDDVKVTAVRQEGSALTEEELARWSLDHLPYFAVPRYVEFRSSLPRNPTGKVLKYQLREEGATATTWDLEASDITMVKR